MGLLASVALSASDVHDMKIKKIKEEREGVSKEKLETTKEPFAIIKQQEEIKVMVIPDIVKESKATFTVNALMEEKAFINGNWHVEGDVIQGYTLGYVGTKGVVLRKDNEVKKVFLQKRSKSTLNIILN